MTFMGEIDSRVAKAQAVSLRFSGIHAAKLLKFAPPHDYTSFLVYFVPVVQ
jgi:hypothetical protein